MKVNSTHQSGCTAARLPLPVLWAHRRGRCCLYSMDHSTHAKSTKLEQQSINCALWECTRLPARAAAAIIRSQYLPNRSLSSAIMGGSTGGKPGTCIAMAGTAPGSCLTVTRSGDHQQVSGALGQCKCVTSPVI